MSNIIDPNDSLIEPAHDRFLDGYPTRRELQKAFNKMGHNDAELFGMCDTQALVGNFLCDKLGVTRAEIEAYILKKAEELKSLRVAQLENAVVAQNTQQAGAEAQPQTLAQEDSAVQAQGVAGE